MVEGDIHVTSFIEHKAEQLKSGLDQVAIISAPTKTPKTLEFIQNQLNPHEGTVYSNSRIFAFHGNY